MKGLPILFCAIILLGCADLLIEDDPGNDLEDNFEIFWKAFDRHYSFFDLKNVDWQAAYDTNIVAVRGFTHSDELFTLLTTLVLDLEDGHVNLYRGRGVERIAFDFTEGFPENSPDLAAGYLNNLQRPNNTIHYADITNTNVGYMRINSFGSNESDYEVIDQIVNEFQSKDGLIIDVRSNGGGSDTNSDRIASRFADTKRLYRRVRYRSGADHSSFTEWIDSFIEPEGPRFLQPVVILTNRGCFSTTESFIMSMKVLPNVSTIGGITGGGTGNPLFRELPIGWTFRLSSWQMVDADFNSFEGVGLSPDRMVEITETDIEQNRDSILEEAIALLEGN